MTKPSRPIVLSPHTNSFFEANTVPDGDCIVWIGRRNARNYGALYQTATKTNVLVHRYAYLYHFGEIPQGLFVCHTCDNPPCVKKEHLFVGTALDNVRDCHEKGRQSMHMLGRTGTKHPSCKLTQEQIDLLLVHPYESAWRIAEKFGVQHGAIWNIRKKHAKGGIVK